MSPDPTVQNVPSSHLHWRHLTHNLRPRRPRTARPLRHKPPKLRNGRRTTATPACPRHTLPRREIRQTRQPRGCGNCPHRLPPARRTRSYHNNNDSPRSLRNTRHARICRHRHATQLDRNETNHKNPLATRKNRVVSRCSGDGCLHSGHSNTIHHHRNPNLPPIDWQETGLVVYIFVRPRRFSCLYIMKTTRAIMTK